jgi:hypothetical protein
MRVGSVPLVFASLSRLRAAVAGHLFDRIPSVDSRGVAPPSGSQAWHLALAVLILLGPFPSHAARPFTMTVERNSTCNNGEVTGRLLVNDAEIARTLELPWRENANSISQIPAGTYRAFIRTDGPLRWRVELKDVKDRSNVQLHIGNYPRQTQGCILLGTSITSAGGTCATENSGRALAEIRDAMQKASDNGVSSQQLDITVIVG